MLKPLTAAHHRTSLADLGVVRVQGAEAIKFLQGQVSNDVARLSPEVSVLAGVHNPQGRAIALLRLVLVGADEVLAVLPRELAGVVATRLAKFVLRAKAKVSDASADWVIEGVEASGIAEGGAGAQVGAVGRDESGGVWVCVDAARPAGAAGPASEADRDDSHGAVTLINGDHASERWLLLRPNAHGATATSTPAATAIAATDESAPINAAARNRWRALDIAAGIPQVYAATSEAFVAQMLNLDVLDGISFEKGCYTGQEVIARAHYRGRIKRRMQRFRTLGPAEPAIGDTGTLADGRSFRIVDCVRLEDGRCEFLAVAPTSSGTESEDAHSPTAAASAQIVLAAEQLSLPYALPA